MPEAPPAAAAPLPPPVPEVSPVDRIRADVEALLAAQGEAAWLAWTTGAPLDVAGPMRGREWIADGGALAALDALPAAADPVEAGRRRMLRDYLVGERLAAAVPEPAPADLTFPFEGRAIALRDTASMLAAEPDAARRAALDAARAPAAARAARDADARAVALADAARRLGLPGLLSIAAELRRASPDALAALASATLDATGPAYCAVMDALARGEVGVPLSSTRLRDLPRILRASHEPRAHPASRLVADGRAAASAAGVDLPTRIKLDDRIVAGKSQRPWRCRSGCRTTSASRPSPPAGPPRPAPSCTSSAWPCSSPGSARTGWSSAASARRPRPPPGATCSRRWPPTRPG